MNKQDKPRICEVLGVEVDEWFAIKDSALICNYFHGREMYIDRFGDFRIADPKPRKGDYVSSEEKMKDIFVLLQHAINYPECIVRRKRFTSQEIEDAKTLKRVVNRMNTIRRLAGGELWLETKDSDMHISMSFSFPGNDSAFPSINPGESYTLDEIIGEG